MPTLATTFINPNDIRHQFSIAMSTMYQVEVPLYADLIDLVQDVNLTVLRDHPDLQQQLQHTGELGRLDLERHGAIRLGTASELSMMRRLFAVMGMYPVGYYDLTPAGVPVHSTAFRAINTQDLNQSPFRLFTSLLRLDLIDDVKLRAQAKDALANRHIFTEEAINLIHIFEQQGGLTTDQADNFIRQALETFRWHDTSPITKPVYEQLLNQHQLIADIVGFQGPHINHLTPRTLDIDVVQQGMTARGIPAKDIIEGPPPRRCPILLRQTSFKALQEPVNFKHTEQDTHETKPSFDAGTHTARFGEIEQRGVALTPKGRALYDALLSDAKSRLGEPPNKANANKYQAILSEVFAAFPDDYQRLHEEKLAYFYYLPVPQRCDSKQGEVKQASQTAKQVNLQSASKSVRQVADDISGNAAIAALIAQGLVHIEPIVYEDFLPVSAAGIFQSNLTECDLTGPDLTAPDLTAPNLNQSNSTQTDSNAPAHSDAHLDRQSAHPNAKNQSPPSNKADFEQALGCAVYDEMRLYEHMQAQSLAECLHALKSKSY